MQIRCVNCHKPFAIGKEEIQAALELLTAENLAHYNASCPHCRKVNRVSRDDLARAMPGRGEAQQEKA